MSEARERPAASGPADAVPPREDPGLERVDGWERFPWLRAGFSTRQGGGSVVDGCGDGAAFAVRPGDQNLGWTAEDDREWVTLARERFVAAVTGGRPCELVTTRQFHSGVITTVEADHGPLRLEDGTSPLRGDGLVTDLPGLLLGVITADCVPVLVADAETRAVAAFHAGWRGTVVRIVEHGVETMRRRYGSRPENLVAAIGPAIGSCCFAVREDVRAEFESQFAYATSLFSEVEGADRSREMRLDLPEANRRQLLDAGLAPEAIQVLRECTACTRLADRRRKYFSYRAEQGVTGRMLSVIGVLAKSQPQPDLGSRTVQDLQSSANKGSRWSWA